MLRKSVFLSFLLIFLTGVCHGQSAGNYTKGFSFQNNIYLFPLSNATVRLEWCTPSMVRIRTSFQKNFEADEAWMVVKYDWLKVDVKTSEQRNRFILRSSALTVEIFKSPLRIDIRSSDGQLLSSESSGKGSGAFQKGDSVGCVKQLFPDEHFFGFGERMDFLDRRHKKLRLDVGRGKGLPHIIGAYNILEANYSPIPFFMSTRGYGIFFHNAFPTEWDMGNSGQDRYAFSAAGGELDYYFIYGPKFPAILQQYTALTGRSPLMPSFAYGLHMGTYSGGTWGYESLSSDGYVVALARKLRELGIPVDILWLDSTWRIFGETGGKGATSFEWRETFKDPAAMFDSLYAMHFKMVGLHLRPRFDNGRKIRLLDTAQRMKYTFPEGSYAGEFVNFFDSSAVDFWWNHGVMRTASMGAKFLKTDEGSAFGAEANESKKTGPQGKEIQKLHNIFPLAYARAPYEKFQQYNGMRGLNQTREGYAGIQRYPYIFAGDWPSEWQYFAPVIKAGINIGLSGVGHWAHCMGGFEHPADPELYIRWVQFGMFSPLALVFGMDHPGYKEPWNYGADALRNFKKYDSIRYALLPYIYSSAWQQYQQGIPMMRALVLDHQDDENVYEIGDQYMFGDNLMVCPVTTKGAQTRTVYLPKGDWFDYWTGKMYHGGNYVHVVTPLDSLPLFAKAGTILPMQPSMRYTNEKPVELLTLEVFPATNGRLDLYEDDGTTLAYEGGQYAITRIESAFSGNSFQFIIHKPVGNFQPSVHQYRIKLHADRRPSRVTENGQALSGVATGSGPGWYFDSTQNLLYISTISNNQSRIQVQVSY